MPDAKYRMRFAAEAHHSQWTKDSLASDSLQDWHTKATWQWASKVPAGLPVVSKPRCQKVQSLVGGAAAGGPAERFVM